MTIRYEIRDAFDTCNGSCDGRIGDCYEDNIVLNATTDEEAISEAEHLQREHDAAALAIIEAAESGAEGWKAWREIEEMEDAYNNAPVYCQSIVRITLDEDGEEIEEELEY